MNKKTIITKTVLFIFIVGFVIGFKVLFGGENTLVGVTTITATLMFLDRDLTSEPFKNCIRLVLLNLIIGIGAGIASYNMYLAIIINFSLLFIISYSLCFNLRKPMYLAFSLQYLFLLSIPVPISKMGIRLLSLVFGAIFIMVVQLIVNKNKMKKSGNKALITICDLIIKKLDNIQIKEPNNKENEKVNNLLEKFRQMVYDKRESGFYLTEEARIKLNLSVALENINIMINSFNFESVDENIFKYLGIFLVDVKNILSNSNDSKDDVKSSEDFELFIEHYNDKNYSNMETLQLLDSVILLCEVVKDLKSLNDKNSDIVKMMGEIPSSFKKHNSILKSIVTDKKSVKFCYAMRIGITIAIGGFIMDYFKLKEGRWILFTILSLVSPIYEVSKSKTKDRLKSTLIGSLVVFVLFSIFKSEASRLTIIMLTGYISSYFSEYKYTILFATIAAIGSAALVGNIQELTLSRIYFVALGTIISVIANKYIFPYNLNDNLEYLKNKYELSIKAMLVEVFTLIEGARQPHTIKNLFIITNLIEAKIRMDLQIRPMENEKLALNARRLLVTNIYQLYLWLAKENVNYEYKEEVLSDIKELISYENSEVALSTEHIDDEISKVDNLRAKITLSSISIIIKELNDINNKKSIHI